MDKETLSEAQKVYTAFITIADFMKMTESEIARNIAFFDDEKWKKIKQTIDLVNDFRDKPLKERAKLMGYEYSEKENGSYEVSTVL